MKKHIFKSFSKIFIIRIFLKILSYFKVFFFAYFFGVSPLTDAFFTAMTISSIAISTIGVSAKNSIIPHYKKDFANKILYLLILICLLLSLIIFLFSKRIIKLFAPGFTDQTIQESSLLLIMMLPFIFFAVLTMYLKGVFQTQKEFVIPELSSFIGSLALLFSILLVHKLGIISLALSYDIYSAVSLIYIIYFLKKNSFFTKIHKFINSELALLKSFLKMFGYIIFTSGAVIIYQIVDKAIASYLAVGSVSILSYAQSIYIIPYYLISVPLASILYPYFVDNKIQIETALVYINLLMSYIILFFASYLNPLIKIFLNHGIMKLSSIKTIAAVVSIYSISLLFSTNNILYEKYFYSKKNAGFTMSISLIAITINVVLDIFLSKKMGIIGLAVATVISSFISYIIFSFKVKFIKESALFISSVLFIIFLFHIIKTNYFLSLLFSFIFLTLLLIIILIIIKKFDSVKKAVLSILQ